jgi:hypothetical protein
MAVFGDYVGLYQDLVDSFNAQNRDTTNSQGRSVINPLRQDVYHQLAGTLEDFQNARANNRNWEHYVWTGGSSVWQPSDGPSDLDNAWNSDANLRKAYNNNKAAWGKAHYESNGQKENREVPFNALDTVLWNSSQYVIRHSQLYGDSYIPNVFQKSDGKVVAVDGPDGWGQQHWEQSGKNEARILPGPKFTLDENGNLGLAEYEGIGSPVGTGLQQNFNDIIKVFNKSTGGNYKGLMEGLEASLTPQAFGDLVSSGDLDTLSGYYAGNKVSAWDSMALGAQPPTGGFDPDYYRLNTRGGGEALNQWNNAQASVNVGDQYLPDLDVVGRYNRDTYLHWYYTTQGKAAGERGNAAELAGLPEQYSEYLTDSDYQLYRDRVLGLADRFDNLKDWADAQDPTVLKEWYNSLPSDQKKEYDAGTLPVPTLDNIPDRLRSQIVMDKGMTILEGTLSPVLGAKEKQQQQVFGALTQDSLKKAAEQLQKMKLQERQFEFYKGLEGFNEIVSLNESLSNSILGDSGFGGILGFSGDPEKAKESLEASLSKATGIPSRSNTIYNWQQWFDNQLVKGYEGGLTVKDPLDPSIEYNVDAAFAKDYIDRYLKPRFDTSRSMTEFVSYMDVKQNEQNVFQTQSALDSLRDIADVRAKAYLDGVRSKDPLNFDVNFYWDPTGNFSADDPKITRYQQQKDELAKDWEAAKTAGNTTVVPGTDWTWSQWAYYYGLDPNDKNQFAKLHYQVKGAANGFDPAKDLITLKDAEDYIQEKIIPEISDEKLKIGDITFLNFVTPEEYADKLLEGLSPDQQKEQWDKLLETLGLSGKEMGVEEVKQYIIDAFRTGAAKEIRETIKYLNEKKLRPTQERIGVEYIERPEDYKPTDSPNQTELYKIFKNAGYQGSEDEFYTNFMTDIDRGEMELLTQGQKGLQLGGAYAGLTSRDPFAALTSIQGLFDDEVDQAKTTTEATSAPSYFNIFGDDKEDEDYKSKTGQKILGEFTSFFKGFS